MGASRETSDGAEAHLAAVMAAARREYLDQRVGTVRELERIAAGLASRPGEPALLSALRQELHRVHGTAGTIGFTEAGRLAAALSVGVRGWEGDPAVDADRRSEIAAEFVRQYRAALDGAAHE